MQHFSGANWKQRLDKPENNLPSVEFKQLLSRDKEQTSISLTQNISE